MPTKKKGFKGKRREIDHLEGGYRGRETKTITLYPKLPTSISTLHFLPKNLSPEEELPKGS